jgi:hypothetical protein
MLINFIRLLYRKFFFTINTNKMSNRIVLLLITVFFIGVSHGMAGIRKANRCFELYEYSRAIPLYLKVVKKGNQVDRREAAARLADCYRLVNNA